MSAEYDELIARYSKYYKSLSPEKRAALDAANERGDVLNIDLSDKALKAVAVEAEVAAEAAATPAVGEALLVAGPVGALAVAVATATGIPLDHYVGNPIQREVAEHLKATGEAPPDDPGAGFDPMSGWNPYGGVE